MSRVISPPILFSALAAVFVGVPAHAHISLEKGGTHLSRYGDEDESIKESPCGKTGGARGSNVYTYQAGETITITFVEAIPHPGYFRVAFDDDGDDAFVDPVSIDPIDPARGCPIGPGDHCGASAFYNNSAVLPGMDNLLPHLPAPADFFNPPRRTFQVTLPNVSCTNCTLQIIQVMEDDAFHGPYDTTPGVGVSDVYHQCIDLVLTGGPPPGTGGAGPGPGAGGTPGAAGATGVSGATGFGGTTGPGGGTGGVTGTAGSTAPGQGGGSMLPGGPGPGPGGAASGPPGGLPGADPGVDSASSEDSGSCSAAAGPPKRGSTLAFTLLAVALGALGIRRSRPRARA